MYCRVYGFLLLSSGSYNSIATVMLRQTVDCVVAAIVRPLSTRRYSAASAASAHLHRYCASASNRCHERVHSMGSACYHNSSVAPQRKEHNDKNHSQKHSQSMDDKSWGYSDGPNQLGERKRATLR